MSSPPVATCQARKPDLLFRVSCGRAVEPVLVGYEKDRQVGLARVVNDRAAFARLCDGAGRDGPCLLAGGGRVAATLHPPGAVAEPGKWQTVSGASRACSGPPGEAIRASDRAGPGNVRAADERYHL